MSIPLASQVAGPNDAGSTTLEELVEIAIGVLKDDKLDFTTKYLSSTRDDNAIQCYFNDALDASTGPILMFVKSLLRVCQPRSRAGAAN